ncbi:MAG TPA: bifunctional 3-deoxy-7-phosphoheptulonate synthase/chorismate mutase [Acidimicrobiia bacterium]|nr:bifunctional 3-deoxy-7-phosphoheptulonate synthase/chorismate mutase [Acidimicrobiia bacterium]
MAPTLKAHRSPDRKTTIVEVGGVRFGDGSYPVIAGPGAVESEEQLRETAELVREGGAAMLRAGAYTRTGAWGTEGLGDRGVELLAAVGAEVGLPVVAQVTDTSHVERVAEQVDMLQVGSDQMQDFSLLRAVGAAEKPVLLKRGPSATIDEWLMSAEYLLADGNDQVILCERGIRTFETRTKRTLDISSVPVVQRISHLPVIIDPSHAAGARDLVVPLALAGRAVGADGMVVEVHARPHEAVADGEQQLDRDGYLLLMDALGVPRLRDEIDRIDREIVRLLAKRLGAAVEIGLIKHERGLALRSPGREAELLADVRNEAETLGVDGEFVTAVFQSILENSRASQRRAVAARRGDGPTPSA